MMNKVMLIGNVGQTPEVRAMGNGDRVANLSVATSEKWTDKASGEKKERTEWHRVTVWNPHLVDVVEKYCQKGTRVYVEGAIRSRKWTDKEGVERVAFEIVIERFKGEIRMLSGGQDAAPAAAARTQRGPALDDDEIPF